jgi:hypothetical protein
MNFIINSFVEVRDALRLGYDFLRGTGSQVDLNNLLCEPSFEDTSCVVSDVLKAGIIIEECDNSNNNAKNWISLPSPPALPVLREVAGVQSYFQPFFKSTGKPAFLNSFKKATGGSESQAAKSSSEDLAPASEKDLRKAPSNVNVEKKQPIVLTNKQVETWKKERRNNKLCICSSCKTCKQALKRLRAKIRKDSYSEVAQNPVVVCINSSYNEENCKTTPSGCYHTGHSFEECTKSQHLICSLCKLPGHIKSFCKLVPKFATAVKMESSNKKEQKKKKPWYVFYVKNFNPKDGWYSKYGSILIMPFDGEQNIEPFDPEIHEKILIDQTPTGFKYAQATWSHFFTGRTYNKFSNLPRFIIDELNSNIYRETNTQNHASMKHILSQNALWKAFTSGSTQQFMLELIKRCDLYFLTFQYYISAPISHLARSVRKNAVKQTSKKQHLKNDNPFFLTRWRAVKIAAVAVFVTGLAVITRKVYKGLSEDLPEWLDRFKDQPDKEFMEIAEALHERRIQDIIYPQPKFTLFPFMPTISVYIEEIIKTVPLGGTLIGLIESLIHGNLEHLWWHTSGPGYLQFTERLHRHFTANKFRGETKPINILQEMHDEVSKGHTFEKDVPYEQTQIDPETCRWLPPFRKPKFSEEQIIMLEQKEIFLPHTGNNLQYDFSENFQGIHTFCFPITNFQKPIDTFDNRMGGIELRCNSIPETDATPNYLKRQKKLWRTMFTDIILNEEAWFQHLKKLQQIVILKTRQEIENDIVYLKHKFFLKANEVVKMGIPRLIYSVNPRFLDSLGDLAFHCSKAFSTSSGPWSCDGPPIYIINGYPVYVYYASGASTTSLSISMARAEAEPCYVMHGLGDDSFIIDSTSGILVFYECDFSKFDATQGPRLIRSFSTFLGFLGFPEHAKIYNLMYKCDIDTKHRKTGLNYKLTRPPGKLTGEPFTSFSNTFFNIMSSLLVIEDGFNPQVYVEAGFSAKFQANLKFPTFLKHVILRDTNGELTPVRLPGFLAKFGKMDSDPLSHYSKNLSPLQRYKMDCLGMWKGYGFMRSNWFYSALDDIISKYCDVKVSSILVNEYGLIQDKQNFYIDDETWNDFMWDRYKLTAFALDCFLLVFEKAIKKMPCVYFDQAVLIMEQRDYE